MALTTDELKALDYSSYRGYEYEYLNHFTGANFYVVTSRAANSWQQTREAWPMGYTYHNYVLVDKESGEIINTWKAQSDEQDGVTYNEMWNMAKDAWSNWNKIESGIPLETGQDVSFDDWSPYFDKEGNVKN